MFRFSDVEIDTDSMKIILSTDVVDATDPVDVSVHYARSTTTPGGWATTLMPKERCPECGWQTDQLIFWYNDHFCWPCILRAILSKDRLDYATDASRDEVTGQVCFGS